MKVNDNLNVQPHSEEAELAVLGSMLSSKEAVSKSLESLKPEHFYKEAHEKIFSTHKNVLKANFYINKQKKDLQKQVFFMYVRDFLN